MASLPTTYLPPEEYLALERKAEFKSEYIDGVMVAMPGASRRHNLIVVNLAREFSQQLRARPCEAYTSDMRVRVPSPRIYPYPDVVVVCGEPQFEDEQVDTLLNPTLIVEVLSESPERYDRGRKFGLYRTIDSLAEYLLVAQDECRIEQYVKQPDGGWLLSDHHALAAMINLSSIQCQLALNEVYDKVAWS
jgi:Uma2 family endonuclease